MNSSWKENNMLFNETSDSTKDIQSDLRYIKNELLVHLLKVFYYRGYIGVCNHWKKEIANFLRDVPRVKSSNKYPSYGLLKLNLFSYRIEDFDRYNRNRVEDFNDNYEDLEKIESTSDNAFDYCEEYYHWLCEELSSRGEVERKEIFDKIDELLDKYPVNKK